MARMWNPKSDVQAAISVNETGIKLTGSDGTLLDEIKWANILNVIAFKRNLWATDLLCLAIAEAGKAVVVTEEMDGWDELLDRAPTYLPGWPRKERWYHRVILPPLEENRTVIFSR